MRRDQMLRRQFFQRVLLRPDGGRRSDFNHALRTGLGGIDAILLEIPHRRHFQVLDSGAAAWIDVEYFRADGGAEPAFPASASINAHPHRKTSILHFLQIILRSKERMVR